MGFDMYFRAVVIIFCFKFAVVSVSGDDPIFKEVVHDGNEKILLSRKIYKDGDSFLFASCNDSKLSTELNCAITTDKLKSPSLRYCPLHKNLPANRRLKSDNLDLELHFLGSSTNIIISWDEIDPTNLRNYKGVAIVNTTNCKTKFLDLFSYPDVPVMHIVVYNDTFDAITLDDPRVCGSKKRCRVTYDSRGKQIGDPRSFPIRSKDISIYPKSSISGSDGFYIFEWEEDNESGSRLVYLSPDNNVTELETAAGRFKKHPEPEVSISYSRLTICGWKASENSQEANEEILLRTRHDIEDNEELGPEWTIENYNHVVTMASYNLPYREFLYLEVTMEESQRQARLSLQHNTIGVRRINVIAETFDFATTGYIQDLKAFITEEGEEYCVYLISVYVLGSPQERLESTLKYYKKCIAKNYSWGR